MNVKKNTKDLDKTITEINDLKKNLLNLRFDTLNYKLPEDPDPGIYSRFPSSLQVEEYFCSPRYI